MRTKRSKQKFYSDRPVDIKFEFSDDHRHELKHRFNYSDRTIENLQRYCALYIVLISQPGDGPPPSEVVRKLRRGSAKTKELIDWIDDLDYITTRRLGSALFYIREQNIAGLKERLDDFEEAIKHLEEQAKSELGRRKFGAPVKTFDPQFARFVAKGLISDNRTIDRRPKGDFVRTMEILFTAVGEPRGRNAIIQLLKKANIAP